MKQSLQRNLGLPQLQFFKFIVFIMVFLFHTQAYHGIGITILPKIVTCGLSFFFMVSGLTTAYSHFNCLPKTVSIAGVIDYVSNKLKKFYPLYFLTVIAAVAFSDIPRFFALHYYEGLKELIPQLIKHLLLLQSWFKNGALDFNAPGWFLSTILFSYCLTIPLLFLIGKIKNSNKALCAAIVVLASAEWGFAYLVRNLDIVYIYRFPPTRLGEYCIGLLIGTFLKANEKEKEGNGFYTVAEAASILIWILFVILNDLGWSYNVAHWLIPNIFVLFAFGLGKGSISSLLRSKTLVYLGDISFECYIIHFIVISFCAWPTYLFDVSKAGNLFMTAYDLMLTVLAACIIHGRPEKTK